MKPFYMLAAVLILLASMYSCSKEEEASRCGENGLFVTDTGECFCEFYYEGPFCETEVREKFIGQWVGSGYSCVGSLGDSIPDGFVVDIIETDDVGKVEIRSEKILDKDTVVAQLQIIGFFKHLEYERVGNKLINTLDLEIYYEEDSERLLGFISRNEDLDEWTESCAFILRRQ